MSVNNKQYFNYLYLILVLGITGLVLFFTLRVRKVECYQQSANDEELQNVCQDLRQAFLGKSLLFYDFAEATIWQELAQKTEYQQLYQIVDLEKTPPGTIRLNLNSRLPDYRLLIIDKDKQEESYILNQNNHLKKDQLQNSIFEVIYLGQDQILSKNKRYLEEDYHQFFLALKDNLDRYQIGAKKLLWRKDDLIELDLGKSYLVIFDKESNPEEVIKNLSLILLDEVVLAEIEKQGFLDMRFRLPVIREQID